MITINPVLCDLCGTCAGVCPADAVIIEGAAIRIDHERCIACLACIRICPVGAPGEEG
jgi:ferredoxin